MARESTAQSNIILRAFELGFTLWRNNSGVLPNEAGVPVRFGVGNDSSKINKVWKSSDLVGIGPYGRWMSVEVKAPGWVSPTNDRERAQKNHLDDVNRRGGIGIFATSPEDFENQIRRLMP